MNIETDIRTVARSLIGLSKKGNPNDFSKTKIFKLSYYCYAWYLVASDKKSRLFDEKIEAWAYGPGMDYLYDNWESILNDTDPIILRDEVEELIQEVYKTYGGLSKHEISELSHSERPWIEARKNLPPNEPSKEAISDDTIYTYYTELYENNTLDELVTNA